MTGWIAFGVSLGLLLGYGYHTLRCYRVWQSIHGATALRDLFIAAMISVSTVAFAFGSAALVWPGSLFDIARFVGWVVRGALLVGAVFVPISWLSGLWKR